MTSAPMAASSCVQNGPARIRVRSTTRIPVSAPMKCVPGSAHGGPDGLHRMQVEPQPRLHDLPRQLPAEHRLHVAGEVDHAADVDAGLDAHLVEQVEQVLGADVRSEEHTSELQSLMRISYAVFCLKKK